ncbi:hypothetical protein TorRG33x02_076970 [Trema orientale]|uniref:Uncharacterized protein n=1 Tax=Trema orientale TaxID=63057 RepID=A0A2P5FF84_TREOI|nr:hypothetical protein TorRG33x02_076970 [Trema orientale]
MRWSLIPPNHLEPRDRRSAPSHIIHCISKLCRAGIKLAWAKGGEEDSFLCMGFHRGVLSMALIMIDDFTTSFLLNCLAFKDVEYLSNRNIVENFYGNDGKMARYINNLRRNIAFDIDVDNTLFAATITTMEEKGSLAGQRNLFRLDREKT